MAVTDGDRSVRSYGRKGLHSRNLRRKLHTETPHRAPPALTIADIVNLCCTQGFHMMDGLPPEILSNILDVLQGNGFERLSPYSSISRVWQTTVEKRTFRNVTVGIDPRAIDKLHATIVTGNVSRAHLVRTINVDLGQSPLDSEARPDGPRRIDTAWWTAAMARLFTALAKIVALMSDSTNVRLIFFAHVRTPTVADWGPILRDTPTSIPELRRVVSVAWRHPIPFVSEADFLALTDKLPDLEECDIDTRDDYDWGRRRRMKCRKELATALFNLSCAKLGTIGIRSVHTECYDEARDPTRLVSPYSCEEDLTLKSMQHLSTLPQLTVLHLTGSHIVSVSFFGNLPLFPTLSEFQLDFAASTTDARWFFVPDEVLIAKIKSSYEDEEESIHEYDSDSDRADPVQLYDSDDEDGPLTF
ncbi:hypothetical protein N0V86_005585 [Didymella sp. IMI 355093]|nr:hypothetical protein N0V86_005585 [Didymella sp. IMI 355093]